ncbi:hypothetical protein LTR17_026880, partial [Elasticomyces elasticus]
SSPPTSSTNIHPHRDKGPADDGVSVSSNCASRPSDLERDLATYRRESQQDSQSSAELLTHAETFHANAACSQHLVVIRYELLQSCLRPFSVGRVSTAMDYAATADVRIGYDFAAETYRWVRLAVSDDAASIKSTASIKFAATSCGTNSSV